MLPEHSGFQKCRGKALLDAPLGTNEKNLSVETAAFGMRVDERHHPWMRSTSADDRGSLGARVCNERDRVVVLPDGVLITPYNVVPNEQNEFCCRVGDVLALLKRDGFPIGPTGSTRDYGLFRPIADCSEHIV